MIKTLVALVLDETVKALEGSRYEMLARSLRPAAGDLADVIEERVKRRLGEELPALLAADRPDDGAVLLETLKKLGVLP